MAGEVCQACGRGGVPQVGAARLLAIVVRVFPVLRVPRQASDLARPGWDVTMTLIQQRGTWKVLDVGNVYPR